MADKRDKQTTTQPQLQPKTSLSALRKALPYVVAVVLFWGLSALYFAPQYSGEVLVMHDMVQFCLDNNFEEAMKLQLRYLDIINDLFIEVNPIPVKEALNLMGKEVGECRLPLIRMEEAKIEKLRSELVKVGIIK